jgi:hypothetical protein
MIHSYKTIRQEEVDKRMSILTLFADVSGFAKVDDGARK